MFKLRLTIKQAPEPHPIGAMAHTRNCQDKNTQCDSFHSLQLRDFRISATQAVLGFSLCHYGNLVTTFLQALLQTPVPHLQNWIVVVGLYKLISNTQFPKALGQPT